MSVPANAPRVYKDSLRWTILLYVSTDPAYTWTVKQMKQEMADMGHTTQAVRSAIEGLRARGLITTQEWRGYPRVMPTHAGCQAMRRWSSGVTGVTA